MADAGQVSSTTPNEVEENDMMAWSESGFSEATGTQEPVPIQSGNVGLFGWEKDVKEAHAGEEVIRRQEEEEEETDELHTSENKAETECLEKSVDLISKPVAYKSPEEPDSTQFVDEIISLEEAEAELVALKEAEEVAVTAAFTREIHDQYPVVSSATELQAAFRSGQILEPLVTTTTTTTTKLQEETFFKSEPQDQDFDISVKDLSVKEEAFSALVEPQKAGSEVLEEKKEPERRNLLEESFRTDSESTPAASASPSARE